MLYRKIDSNGDYVFGQNMDGFYSGAKACGQAIYTSLKLLQGEWWEDQQDGLPLFQHILGQSGTLEHIRGADMLIQERILGVEGVTAISSFESSYDSAKRTYTITNATVQTQFGDVILKGVTFTP